MNLMRKADYKASKYHSLCSAKMVKIICVWLKYHYKRHRSTSLLKVTESQQLFIRTGSVNTPTSLYFSSETH